MIEPEANMNPRKSSLGVAIRVGVLCALCATWAGARAQSQSKSGEKIPPRPAPPCCGYPFPRSTDAEIADGDVHRVLYEDEHVLFLEVANPPGLDIHMHGHPYASVFAHDSNTGVRASGAPPPPAGGYDTMLVRDSPYNDMGSGDGPPQ